MQFHLTFLWKVNITCYTINSDFFLAISFKTNELLTRHWVMVSCLQRFLFLYFAKHSLILGFVIKKKVTFWVQFSWNQQALQAAGKTREKFFYLFFKTLYDFDPIWARFLQPGKTPKYSHKKLIAETLSISYLSSSLSLTSNLRPCHTICVAICGAAILCGGPPSCAH